MVEVVVEYLRFGCKGDRGIVRYLPLVITFLFAISVPGLAAPRLMMVSPQEGQVVGGRNVEISVSYDTRSDEKITYVELEIDGQRVQERHFDEPRARGICSFIWDSGEFKNGSYEISLNVHSENGLLGTVSSERRIANLPLDITPPAVEFLNISSGQRLAGEVELEITATDDSGEPPLVALAINGSLKFLKNNPPYTHVWDTAKYDDGEYVIEAWAVDAADNQPAATTINVLVDNRTEAVQPTQAKTPDRKTDTETAITRLDEATTSEQVVAAASPTLHQKVVMEDPAIPTEIQALISAPARVSAPAWTGGATISANASERLNEPLVRFIDTTHVENWEDAIASTLYSTEIAVPMLPPVRTLPETQTEVARAPVEPDFPLLGGQLVTPVYESAATRSVPPSTGLAQVPNVVRVALLPTNSYRQAPARIVEPLERRPSIRYALPSSIEVPAGKLQVEMYGERFTVDVEVKRGVPMVPLRQVWNHVNGGLSWCPDTKTVSGFSRMVDTGIKIGSKDAVVNGASVFLPMAPYIQGGRTMVPLAFLQHVFGMDLDFNEKMRSYTLALR